jgi:dTDP-4-amino-4,6-dideoxygalactose transaminase
LAAFSFHETKNIISGEGGMLVVNDLQFAERAEIIWEKGTNRSSFFRGEVDKYGWVDVGSSFLPSEITAAFLWAQLEKIDFVQATRISLWESYYNGLHTWSNENFVLLPKIPSFGTNNAHMFYMICPNLEFRNSLIYQLKCENINLVFHYQSLHKSPFFLQKHDGRELYRSDRFTDCLIRLPMWIGLETEIVIDKINSQFFKSKIG